LQLETVHPGVYKINKDSQKFLVTRNLTPGRTFYNEPVFDFEGVEYRSWNPTRSKLGAAILKGLEIMPIKYGINILYLGVASGTTCSHVSDVIGVTGHVWAIDFAPRALRDFLDKLSRFRDNISPILGDAQKPGDYIMLVPKVDVIYADIAQPNQAEIVVKNKQIFLKKSGWVMFSIKSRSIDVSMDPKKVYSQQIKVLEDGGLFVHEFLELDPFEKDHAMVIAEFV
jgi:fibrillarin-like pre-rRNA processing protein